MKQLHVDFIAQRSTQWLNIGAVALVILVVVLLGWKYVQLRAIQELLMANNIVLQEKINAAKAMTRTHVPSEGELKQKRTAIQVAQYLQRDLNKPLSTLENIKVPGVRLRNLNLDNSQDLVEVEFELPSLAHVSQLNEDLRSGYTFNPWHFQGAVLQSSSTGLNSANVSTGIYVGRWKAKWSEL